MPPIEYIADASTLSSGEWFHHIACGVKCGRGGLRHAPDTPALDSFNGGVKLQTCTNDIRESTMYRDE